MAMYSFVPHFREATFCGVLSCVFDKLGCVADEKRLRNTAVDLYLQSVLITAGLQAILTDSFYDFPQSV
jgi:hypothetical protein